MEKFKFALGLENNNQLLLNLRMPQVEQGLLREACEKAIQENQLSNQIWLASSGTTGKPKLFSFQESALQCAAKSLCSYLNLGSSDIVFNSLPLFHIGGLMMWVRAQSIDAVFIDHDQAWNPTHYHEQWIQNSVTFISLVPTQLYDLVQLNLSAPPAIKHVLIGGGGISNHLFDKAMDLGWPILQSFGMTETAAAFCVKRNEADFFILPHIKLKTDQDQRLWVSGDSLYSHRSAWDAKCGAYKLSSLGKGEWYLSEDRAQIHSQSGRLNLLGRHDSDFIKIGGESVHLGNLNLKLQEVLLMLDLRLQDFALVPKTSERLGVEICLYVRPCDPEIVNKVTESFNHLVMPFERIRSVNHVDQIQFSELGKLKKEQ